MFSSVTLFSQALQFNIINKTGYHLYGVYTSPAEDNDWGDDLLTYDYFGNNTQVDIYIASTYGKSCLFDILITTDPSEQEYFIIEKADLCRIISITFLPNDRYSIEYIDN